MSTNTNNVMDKEVAVGQIWKYHDMRFTVKRLFAHTPLDFDIDVEFEGPVPLPFVRVPRSTLLSNPKWVLILDPRPIPVKRAQEISVGQIWQKQGLLDYLRLRVLDLKNSAGLIKLESINDREIFGYTPATLQNSFELIYDPRKGADISMPICAIQTSAPTFNTCERVCYLFPGHKGPHLPGGLCFAHGDYIGLACPQWPNCERDHMNSAKKIMDRFKSDGDLILACQEITEEAKKVLHNIHKPFSVFTDAMLQEALAKNKEALAQLERTINLSKNVVHWWNAASTGTECGVSAIKTKVQLTIHFDVDCVTCLKCLREGYKAYLRSRVK